MTYTQEQIRAANEQIRANYIAAIKRLKPAVLKDTQEDRAFIERLITQYMLANQSEATPENFYSAFKHHMKVLPWSVKPAQLVFEEQNERPIKNQSEQQALKQFQDWDKASKQADAQKAADEASIKQIKSLIVAYLPTKSTPVGERIDYTEQVKMQAHWTKAFDQEIAGKGNLQSFATVLAAAIQKRYLDREKQNEKVGGGR